MIYGIGIDIVKIDRIRTAVERWGDHFLEKVFTRDEIAYCHARSVPFLSLAVRFAAKEALIKAMGTKASGSFRDIEVVVAGSGRPSVRVQGRIRDFLQSRKISGIHLSMSHEQEFGVASVILEVKASDAV